jgi:hypothetical protein
MASAAGCLLAVPAMASEDVDAKLAEMQEVVKGLQEKVQAQDEQIEHQGKLLEDAQRVVRADDQGTLSGLAAFIDSLEVDGHVAGSYNYNFNTTADNNGGGFDGNSGANGLFLPFHRDSNTFQVDQVWFGLGKPATEESRGGFRFDIMYGAAANVYGSGDDFGRRQQGDSTSDMVIDQAFVEYLAPVANINFKLGKFATPVGAEVIRQPNNFNITRGIVYSAMQPVNHVGLMGTIPIGDMFSLGAGLVNSGGSVVSAPDDNKERSYIATALIGDARMNLRTSFIYGSDENALGEQLGDQTGLADVTAWFNPTDNLSLWANYDYLYVEGTGYYAHGIALAGRMEVFPDFGVALRGEYINEDPASSTNGDESLIIINPGSSDEGTNEIWSITGTVDYALTDHLTVKSELRWDKVTGNKTRGNCCEFPEGGPTSFGDTDQMVWLLAAEYVF